MKRWKAWFELEETRFAIEFEGSYNSVTAAAEKLATRLNAVFTYDMEELK